MANVRVRWAAIGAAVAVSLGAGGIGLVNAAKGSGERGVYTAINPCRLTDTRPEFAVGSRDTPLGAGDVHTIKITGNSGECSGVPNDVIAAGLNVTAVDSTEPTFLTIWPGGTRPNASSLNPSPGQPPVPNAVSVDLTDDGTFQVFNLQGNVHLIVDLVGIYQHHHHDDRYYREGEVDNLLDNLEGQPGPQGPTGPQGPDGPQGDRGLSAWDPIPTGVTVVGAEMWELPATGPSVHYDFSVSLPARAPQSLNDAVKFAESSGTSPLILGGDPACTGSPGDPTAPPGKVCLYLTFSQRATNLQGLGNLPLGTGFRVRWASASTATAGDGVIVQLTWAYTAP